MSNFWKSTNGIITIVGIVVVVLAIIGIGLYYAFGKDEEKPNNSKDNEDQKGKNTQTPNGQEVNVNKGNSVPVNTKTTSNLGGSSYGGRSNSSINNVNSSMPRPLTNTMTNINARKNTINPTINNNPNRTHNLTPNQVNVRASRGPSANPLQPNQNNNLGNNPTNNVNPPADFGSANNNINNNNLLNNPINNNPINNEINNINNNDRPDNSENDEEDNNVQVPPLNLPNEENGDGIPEGAGGEGGEEEQIIEDPRVPEESSVDANEENEVKRKGDIDVSLQKIFDKQDKKNNADVLKKSVEKWLNQARVLKAKDPKTRLLKRNEIAFSSLLGSSVRVAIKKLHPYKNIKIDGQAMSEYFKHTKSTDKEWKDDKQADGKISFYKYFFDLFDKTTSVEEKNLLYSMANTVCSDESLRVEYWINILRTCIDRSKDKMNENILISSHKDHFGLNIKNSSPTMKKIRPHIVLDMIDAQLKAKINETKKSTEAPELIKFNLAIEPVQAERKFFKSENNPSLSLEALGLDKPMKRGE